MHNGMLFNGRLMNSLIDGDDLDVDDSFEVEERSKLSSINKKETLARHGSSNYRYEPTACLLLRTIRM